MIVICQGFGENRTAPPSNSTRHSNLRLKYISFLWSREETDGERTGRRASSTWCHNACLARLPFVAQSAGQRREADTKNRQDSLQDTLCAIATHRRRDKAVSCLDTSLAHSPQLSHGTGLTVGLLLGLADCYSGASAAKIYTLAQNVWDCRALKIKTRKHMQCYKTHLFYSGFEAPPFHKPFHGYLLRLFKLIFSDAVHKKVPQAWWRWLGKRDKPLVLPHGLLSFYTLFLSMSSKMQRESNDD